MKKGVVLFFLISTVWFSMLYCKKESTNGKAIFWTASKTLGGKYIDIFVEKQLTGRIEVYSTDGKKPDCGIEGFVTIERPAGTYNYKAVGQDSSIWTGQINIWKDDCSGMELTEKK